MPNVQGTFLRSLIEAKEVIGRFEDANRLRGTLAAFCGRSSSEDALFHHRRHIEAITAKHVCCSRPELRDAGAAAFVTRRNVPQAQRQLGNQTEVLENLAVAAELSDDSSGEHPFRVARLAELMARETGLSNEFCERISIAARLHDIGKTGVPPELLKKPAALSASERELIQRHTIVGAELLSSTAIDELTMATEIALYHHECWDGSGYPTGLAGAQIPLAARITSVAETFDALTHDRSYRPRMSITRALELISERSGRNFEPVLVQSLCNVVGRILKSTSDLEGFLASDAREASPFLRAKREMSRRILGSRDFN